jgi:anti-sigma regulatory factor (Ser/Thr protein kinase)
MNTLRVPAVLESLEQVRDVVKEAAAEAELEKKAMYRLILAVDEVMTNIIVHGYEEHGLEGDIGVRIDLNAEQLSVVLEDQAVAFNPLKASEPDDLDVPLEERDIGGLGVYLALRGVDRFVYERIDEHNHNIMTMFLSPTQ